MNGWVVLLWSFVSALILIIAGIFGSLVVMDRISLFPEAAPTAVPTPVETGVVDTTYAVTVLNATPEEGLDAQVRDTLTNAGFGTVYASDSGSQDFAETTVYYVEDADRPAALGVADLLGGAAVAQDDFYAGLNEGQKQVTVVIGLDRTTTGGESEGETPAP